MYKHKCDSKCDTINCPMGTLRTDKTVDCYYYGLVSLNKCKECTTRKDKFYIKK